MSVFDSYAIGSLIGIQRGNRLNAQEFEQERARLQAALQAATVDTISQEAQKDAIYSCVEAVVGELGMRDAGVPFERRHSDPEATQVRGRDFIDTADENLERLSGGRLSFSAGSRYRIERSKADVLDIVTKSFIQPEAVPSPMPRRKR